MIAERKDLDIDTVIKEMAAVAMDNPYITGDETPSNRSVGSNLSEIKEFVVKQVNKENAKWFSVFTSLVVIIIRLYTTL